VRRLPESGFAEARTGSGSGKGHGDTTGYAHDLPRSEVVTLARRWAAAGAVVCISEAEPIPELVADGWFQVEITGLRKGQKRTFSKQQREWLTISHPPKWVPTPLMEIDEIISFFSSDKP
jgi:hypothetical protein